MVSVEGKAPSLELAATVSDVLVANQYKLGLTRNPASFPALADIWPLELILPDITSVAVTVAADKVLSSVKSCAVIVVVELPLILPDAVTCEVLTFVMLPTVSLSAPGLKESPVVDVFKFSAVADELFESTITG